MRLSRRTSSIVPNAGDPKLCLVGDCKGHGVCVWRGADVEIIGLKTVIRDLIEGQYDDPMRVIAFNAFKHWGNDVSEDVARELRRRVELEDEEISHTVEGIRHPPGRTHSGVLSPLPSATVRPFSKRRTCAAKLP
jgi:hypothetical protein